MGAVDRVVYQFWAGDNPMSESRVACLHSGENIGVPVRLVDTSGLLQYVLPAHPLHPGYSLLSPTHRADYLRCYFMHFMGGGYADIKWFLPDNNWAEAFDILDSRPEVDIVGSPEIGGGAAVPAYNADSVRGLLIATCFFVARPGSEFTALWLRRTEDYLSVMHRQLALHAEGRGPYPIPWVGLLGYNFHMTCRDVARRRPEAVSRELRTGWDRSRPWR